LAKQKHKVDYRRALLEAYKEKCAYCGDAVRLASVEIDHVLPESLANDPEARARELENQGLNETFEILGRLNHVPACRRCNGDKSSQTYPPNRIMIILQGRKELEPKIQKLEAKYSKQKAADNLLAQTGAAFERGDLSESDLKAAFLDVFNEKEGSEEDGPIPPIDSEVLRLLANASDALLAWPTTINDKWLERPELEQLHEQLCRDTESFTVLLGEPGSGKSALLARLGQDLRDSGSLLLALKADLIPANVGKLSDLQDFLGLQTPIAECISEIARSRQVVLLIDQLDALGDLMDQKTQRLRAILELLQRVRKVENVHIVVSCRRFEFEHDLRLASLAPKSIDLQPPTWDAVAQILESRGVGTETWTNEQRELLRRPQHLSLFVRHFADSATPQIFTSYQRMMESVIERCTTGGLHAELNRERVGLARGIHRRERGSVDSSNSS